MQRSAVRDAGTLRTFARPSPHPRRARSATPYLIAVILAAFLPAASAQLAEAPALFEPPTTGFMEAAIAPLDSSALRIRSLVVNTQLFTTLPPGQTRRVRLPLFADRDYTAVVTEQEGAGTPFFGWRGRLEGYVNGHFSAVLHDGALVMQITDGRGGEFQIRPVPGGGHQVAEPWPGVQGVCGSVGPPAPALAVGKDAGKHPPANLSPSWVNTHADVLILYTPNARNAAGGHANIQAKARQFVADSNWRFGRSGTHTYLRLVGVEEIAYDDSAQDLSLHLTRLGIGNDGYMDDAFARRDAVGADLVCLLPNGRANSGSTLGIAYVGGWAGVVEWSLDTLVFTHEIGHNLGCEHEDGQTSYNRGYSHTESWNVVIGTVMEQRVTVMYSGFNPGTRTDYFSSPGINFTFTGNDCGGVCGNVDRPLGIANVADNARWLNENRATTATNRQAIFYGNSAGGAGEATASDPANNLPFIYNAWFPATEVNPAQSATIRLAAGNYPSGARLDKKIRLENWGGGNARITQ